MGQIKQELEPTNAKPLAQRMHPEISFLAPISGPYVLAGHGVLSLAPPTQ
jgi:hypothetical protein